MHGMLALAAVHDRYLGISVEKHRSFRELNHWSQCTVLFAEMLTGVIREETKDPCWATASTLGILTFSSTDAGISGKRAWPLGPEDASDLQWIRLGTGKMKLWQMLNPLRPQSAFKPMAHILAQISAPLPESGAEGISPDVAKFCGIDEFSTPENNAYFNIAHGLAHLLKVQDPHETYGSALRVSGHMSGDFEVLLRTRDPVALVLLCIWYEKARRAKWWIEMRAQFEHAAIREYLQQHHSEHAATQKLLAW